MPSFLRPAWTPIGVDLSGRTINAVQLRRRPGRPRLDAVASIRRADPEAALELDELYHLQEVLDRRGFRGREIVLGIPSEHVLLDVVPAPRREIEVEDFGAVRDELARRQRWDTESFEMTCWPLPGTRRRDPTVKVMAAACLHEESTPFLDAMESVGFDVLAIDAQPLALARVAARAMDDEPCLWGMLSMEWTAATLVVFSADDVVYVRPLEQAGLNRLEASVRSRLDLEEDITEHIMARVGVLRPDDAPRSPRLETVQAQIVSFVDGLITELRRSLTYSSQEFPDTPITRLAVVGTGAMIGGLDRFLANSLGVTTTIVSPVDSFDCRPDIESFTADPQLCAATGLALWS
ncbi:MAG: pilus assembly protein PilM [Planctomycetota bacterium]|jgi:Tfp pilus assembly PilM family ATPase